MVPRTRDQFEQLREASRDRILESALRLFAEHGYERTSIRMIAREAGISQGLTYNYFASKEALLRAIFERSMEDVRMSFGGAAAGATPRARIEGLVRSAFEIVREHLPFWRLTYQIRMQPGVLEGLGEYVAAWSGETRERLEALMREAGVRSAAVEARLLHAAIDGAAQHYALDPEGYPLDEIAESLIRRFVSPLPGETPTSEPEAES